MSEQQPSMPSPALYSQNFKTNSKTYFFDVKAAKNGNKYLSITESRIKDGQKFRSAITVFPDTMQAFSETVAQMQAQVQ